MDTETLNAEGSALTDQYAEDQAIFSQFKDALVAFRSTRINLAGIIQGLQAKIETLDDSYSNVLSMFKTEAVQMYPELQGQDAEAVLSTLAVGHPLLQLWDQYSQKLSAIEDQLDQLSSDITTQVGAYTNAANNEIATLQMYDDFQSSTATELPSPQDMFNALFQVEALPYVEQSSTNANLNAIALLDPEAAALVTLQATKIQQEGDYSEASDQTQSQGSSQVTTLNATSVDMNTGFTDPGIFDREVTSQSLTDSGLVDPALISSDDMTKNKNFLKYMAAAMVALYIFGRK